MFRNTGANAFAKNQMRLAYEDKRDLYCISAFTTGRVTGQLTVIDWAKHGHKWNHLHDVQFPSVRTRNIVDMLIGIDYANLHYSMKDIRGQPGDPVARLTPLGWTCIGRPSRGEFVQQSHLIYFSSDHGLDQLVRKFWEMEDSGISHSKTESKQFDITDMIEESLIYEYGHYSISIPWKEDTPSLPDNYNMAVKRLQNTEKRPQRDPTLASAYSEVIDRYTKKGYIRRVPKEEHGVNGWLLPHFPVVRTDKETTKVRILNS